MDTYIGFDSAWTDNQKSPGAICGVSIVDGAPVRFHAPELASFDQALTFIRNKRSNDGITLIALDQPTVVRNPTGMRPVESVAASLVSWLGGGVQPSNQGNQHIFGDAAPIRRFLTALDAVEDPERARTATDGLYLMEVFPALALASLDDDFFGRLRAPKYNPKNKKKYRQDDWRRVAQAAAREAEALSCKEVVQWCRSAGENAQPRRADQDRLDAALCVLTALRWRLRPRTASLLIGDLENGYMVVPVGSKVREYLTAPAQKYSVAMDGVVL